MTTTANGTSSECTTHANSSELHELLNAAGIIMESESLCEIMMLSFGSEDEITPQIVN
ncbi:hypothetical protein [Rhodopirellula sp. SWK7]|uniref:hypothetical protein n=1 Tax=Rhodopirellula sp. SWK7 TaxID=595460 RepID=UPI00034C3745|nr:hypothetical protein [Rhodopirellula sp. SWK7]